MTEENVIPTIPTLNDLKIAHDWIVKKVERASNNIAGNPENYNRMIVLHSEITDYIDGRVAKIIADIRIHVETEKKIINDNNTEQTPNVDTQG